MKNNQILLHDVGALIRKLRKEKRMSGVDLGAELGISQQQISRYENATSEISVSTLIN
ncbi:helix-turn-helix transcriptional regulator, partial [Morganella morganii]